MELLQQKRGKGPGVANPEEFLLEESCPGSLPLSYLALGTIAIL